MLAEPNRNYEIKVDNSREVSNTVIISADSVSKAVTLFLRDYLKNGRINVEITEHQTTGRKI